MDNFVLRFWVPLTLNFRSGMKTSKNSQIPSWCLIFSEIDPQGHTVCQVNSSTPGSSWQHGGSEWHQEVAAALSGKQHYYLLMSQRSLNSLDHQRSRESATKQTQKNEQELQVLWTHTGTCHTGWAQCNTKGIIFKTLTLKPSY